NGYNDTHMGRLLLHSNEFDDNYTSVMDCGNFLKRVYQGRREGDSVASAQFQLLAAQTRRNKIPAQMPADVSVANKTGELGDVENDAGIIYNVSNELIIVFMSENLTEVGSAQSTIASLSRQIYDFYNSEIITGVKRSRRGRRMCGKYFKVKEVFTMKKKMEGQNGFSLLKWAALLVFVFV